MSRVVHFEINSDNPQRALSFYQSVKEKMPLPGVGYLAYCQDTENNAFCIIEMDEKVTV